MRGEHFDEARLVAYARDQLQKNGDDLVATTHGRFTLWASRSDPTVVGFLIDPQTFVLGAGGWGPKMADLAESARPVDSAATDVDLVNLVERAAGSHALWAAAIVPESTRKSLASDPHFSDAAAILTLSAGVDLGKGLEAQLLADLATAAEAKSLALKVTESLRDAKRNPEVLMLGLGPYLDGVTATAVDHAFDAARHAQRAGVRRSPRPPRAACWRSCTAARRSRAWRADGQRRSASRRAARRRGTCGSR